jgi:hypothetical protein
MGNTQTLDLSKSGDMMKAIDSSPDIKSFRVKAQDHWSAYGIKKTIIATPEIIWYAFLYGKYDIAEYIIQFGMAKCDLNDYYYISVWTNSVKNHKLIKDMIKYKFPQIQATLEEDVIILTAMGKCDLCEKIIAEYKIDTSNFDKKIRFSVNKNGNIYVNDMNGLCTSYGIRNLYEKYIAGKKQSPEVYELLMKHGSDKLKELVSIDMK